MVRVSDAGEAAQAAAAGIDAVEFVLDDGPSSALDVVHETRKAFPRLLRLRARTSSLTPEIAAAATATGADEVAFRLDTSSRAAAMGDARQPPHLKTVGLLSTADRLDDIPGVRGRVDALMLEPGTHARLIDAAPIATIDAFATACRDAGLGFGLAGRLEAPDVARLLLLAPDLLAFDTAVREGHATDGALDPRALGAIRAIVPQGAARPKTTRIAKVTDRIFVRDFEVALAIGAYRAEHGKRQRVRFSVVAETVRAAGTPHDMRDVFSYDIIIETIRVLAERSHVTFVETLAEEVAASILAHAEVVAVEVKVEKLDVVSGAVGIEILRRRDAP